MDEYPNSRSTEYKSWQHMKDRCLNPNNDRYHQYGGRGITVQKSWINSFKNFIDDMGIKPDKSYSIERIDTNGNYCKSNCKWASYTEQNRNKRLSKNNKTGVTGVTVLKDERYRAYIEYRLDNKRKAVNLGTYNTLQEATEARLNGERKYWI